MDTIIRHDLSYILSFLDDEKDVASASAVCKLWNAETEHLWWRFLLACYNLFILWEQKATVVLKRQT